MTRSTVLEGSHKIPAFYACYLLRSRSTPTCRRTYVGSTPDPPRRIRQHNGELTQGAWKTSRYRPWEMQMIVYGFPSKLSALQFEWAWQTPELSRHLRSEAGPDFKKDAKRNWVERKVAVCRRLLSKTPFSRLPLNVRFFNEDVKRMFEALDDPLTAVQFVLDLGGVSGAMLARQHDTPGVTSQHGPIDVQDRDFHDDSWSRWLQVAGQDVDCAECGLAIETSDHLTFSLCPRDDCLSTAHLKCLASRFSTGNELLPNSGDCSACGGRVRWGEIIRACYRRREGPRKPTRKRAGGPPTSYSGDEFSSEASSEASLIPD